MVEFGLQKINEAAERLERLEKTSKVELDKSCKITKMAKDTH